ncbi:hypothetical protein [Nitrososphaera viennensis]|uniref:Uncharacterized protein n=2 Tax=Nitrososphaera viennensis TaxID=1034015 RepID=A0A060HK41_9ARCH|nr:hypothetical protein [Nitrososphaera viennensis]AIC15665.1 exported protein of unknown function [Nitrososphaera viennensis EN76]UVS70538.1 hypothetical protein NWT39_07070 [Nitrososphaera viennensis]
MERKSTTALLLAAMMVGGGLAYASAGQRAFAHNFSGDESAAFLANMDTLKIHLMLVGGNYMGNHELAREHAEHAAGHLSADTIKEISEKNQRLGTDLPAALEKLKTSVEGNSPRSEIVQQIRDINGLLGETVTVRIDSGQLTNSTVRALVFANLVDGILESYQGAYGMAEGGSHDHSGSSMNMTGSTEEAHDKIVNMPAYQSAKWLTLKASSLYYKLNAGAPDGSADSMAALRSGLNELKSAVDSRASLESVTVIVHGKVHENLAKAFDLPLDGHAAESHDDDEESSMDMSGNMTGNNMTQ